MQRGTCRPSAFTCDLYVADGFAYGPIGQSMFVINVNNVDTPQVVTTYQAPTQIFDVCTDGDTMYAAEGGGVYTYNIADRAAILPVDSFRTPGNPSAVAKNGNELLVADVSSLLILSPVMPNGIAPKSNLPLSFALAQNYPNPFNGMTTLNYRLNQAEPIDLAVYDLLGRRAATLASGVQAAGDHRVSWNASGVASGVYFATLKAGAATRTVKMMLLK